MSELVSELLNFFEQREGQHISDVDIEAVMEKAAVRIEQLEAMESAVREMLDGGEWRRVKYRVSGIRHLNDMYDSKAIEKDEKLIQAVRDKLGEES